MHLRRHARIRQGGRRAGRLAPTGAGHVAASVPRAHGTLMLPSSELPASLQRVNARVTRESVRLLLRHSNAPMGTHQHHQGASRNHMFSTRTRTRYSTQYVSFGESSLSQDSLAARVSVSTPTATHDCCARLRASGSAPGRGDRSGSRRSPTPHPAHHTATRGPACGADYTDHSLHVQRRRVTRGS